MYPRRRDRWMDVFPMLIVPRHLFEVLPFQIRDGVQPASYKSTTREERVLKRPRRHSESCPLNGTIHMLRTLCPDPLLLELPCGVEIVPTVPTGRPPP